MAVGRETGIVEAVGIENIRFRADSRDYAGKGGRGRRAHRRDLGRVNALH
jgi:hypothetical protein